MLPLQSEDHAALRRLWEDLVGLGLEANWLLVEIEAALEDASDDSDVEHVREHAAGKVIDNPVVMIVEDDPDVRDSVAMLLELEGYIVVDAPDGSTALDLAQHHHPSVILLDMRMPVMDGWQFAQAYRHLPPPHAAIVTMTAAQDAGKWANEIGADGILAKPFEVGDLIAAVERLVT